MQYLVLTSDNGAIDWNSHTALLKEEATHVWGLYKKGKLRTIWFNELKDAVFIVEADTIEEAKSIVEEFPLVKNKLILFTVHALLPYTGFERIPYGTN